MTNEILGIDTGGSAIKVVPAEFFNQAGIVGAALWAAQAKK